MSGFPIPPLNLSDNGHVSAPQNARNGGANTFSVNKGVPLWAVGAGFAAVLLVVLIK